MAATLFPLVAEKGTNPLFHHGLKNFCRALWEQRLLLSSFMLTISNFSIYFVQILKVWLHNYQQGDEQNSVNEIHPIVLKKASDFVSCFSTVSKFLILLIKFAISY